MKKITPADLADLFTEPPRPPAPAPEPATIEHACFVCGRHGMHIVASAAHAPAPLVVCTVCRMNTPASLTALELRIVAEEERLAAACAAFDQVMDDASDMDLARYERMRDAISESIGNPALWEKVKAAQERARAKGDGLSAILAAEAECHRVATACSAALADLNEVFYTLYRLDEAKGWSVPDEATQRRLAMGQPCGERRRALAA